MRVYEHKHHKSNGPLHVSIALTVIYNMLKCWSTRIYKVDKYRSTLLWHRDILFYEQQNMFCRSIQLSQDANPHYINYAYFFLKLLVYHRLNRYHHESYIILKIEFSV